MTEPVFKTHLTFEGSLTTDGLEEIVDRLGYEDLEVISTQEEMDVWLDAPEDAVVRLASHGEPPLDAIAWLSERYPHLTFKVWYSCPSLYMEAVAHYREGYMTHSHDVEEQ